MSDTLSVSYTHLDVYKRQHQERVIQDSERLAKEQAAGEQAGKDQESGDEASSERREYGFIAVSSGEGLSDIFRGIGADCLIEGGQTMNPSTEDMLKAIDRVNAENIFILPLSLIHISLERPGDRADQKVDEELMAGKLERFFGELSAAWEGKPKVLVRAVMSKILSRLPVFFDSLEEVRLYVEGSLRSCSDSKEKEISMRLIRMLIEQDIFDLEDY